MATVILVTDMAHQTESPEASSLGIAVGVSGSPGTPSRDNGVDNLEGGIPVDSVEPSQALVEVGRGCSPLVSR
jgi:hypothetical protein